MKKYGLYLMMIVTTLFSVTSCGDDDDNHQEQWMIANLTAFNAIKTDPEYKELVSPGNEGSIYYKVLEAGTGTDSIRYTSAVSCYYKGCYVADYPEYNIEKGDVCDQRLFDGSPSVFTLNSVMSGWKTALQHMVKGDKWEIWIPYQLAYGRSGYKNSSTSVVIPGYSTLMFEISIVDVKGVDD
ncbi:MAG: FKBP-type peptidyl-prolyl cis-trans isomerase [Tannerella sp.]|jgi:peptidylprolyl isomerase/FKBP-type peptidyl-prolyl cis-trans isomerase FklB|nr:FKBP-type peptidyl-prolyl cis-trans isomerase [Tannerella sp.]